MRLVDTAKGRIPFDQLEVREVKSSGDNDESVAREWYFNGEMVRRDAWVTLLRGNDTQAQTGDFNG